MINERVSAMTYAYTPGLKIKQSTIIRKTRLLPLPGSVLVERNSSVDFNTIVARTMKVGESQIVKASNLLGIESEELSQYLLKKEGDPVRKDEVIAKYIAFFGLSKKFVQSPLDGTIESISQSTGRIVVRAPPVPVEVNAYVPGKVIDIIPNEGVVIELNGAFIQGIFGVGGENHGPLHLSVESPSEMLTIDKISETQHGKILIGGSGVTSEALKKASEIGVKGIIVGGIDEADLTSFLGYEIGVALTGEEKINLTLIITEGFGKMGMSQKTYNILKNSQNVVASINGTTQIRAGVLRPEIIIPQLGSKPSSDDLKSLPEGMVPGTKVRIIRDPSFGEIGTINNLPLHLQKLETESEARVLEVKLEDGNKILVPRANVEIIEE